MEMDDLMLQKQLASTEIQLQYAQSLPKREVLTTEFTTRPLGLFQGQFGCLAQKAAPLSATLGTSYRATAACRTLSPITRHC